METQKQGVIDQVNESKKQGRKTKDILKVPLTSADRELIIKTKNENPLLRHRQIQGLLLIWPEV